MSAIFSSIAWCATGALTLDGALRITPSALFRTLRERPSLVLRFLFVVWIAAPALAIGVTRVFHLHGAGGAAVLLMAICPGVPVVLWSTRSLSGATNTALVVLLASALTAPVFMPPLAKLISALHPAQFSVPSRRIVLTLLPTVFAPIALGLSVRALSPRLAGALARLTDVVARAGFAVVVVGVLVRGGPLLMSVPPRTFVAVVIVTLGEALLGYWAGGPDPGDRRATSMAAALGNPALALAVVAVSYPGYKAVTVVAAYVLIRAIALIPFKRWLKPGPSPRAHRATAR